MPSSSSSSSSESLSWIDIVKIIILVVVTVFISLFYAKDPYKLASKHPNVSLFIVCLIAFGAFYWTYKTENHPVMSFDFFKFIVIIVCFIVLLSTLSRHWTLGKTNIFILFLLIAAACLLLLNLFLFYFSMMDSRYTKTNVNSKQIIKYQSLFFSVVGYFLFLSFSILTIILLATYIISLISFFSSQSQVVRWILGGFLVFLMLYLLYRIVSVLHIYEKSPALRLVIDTVFYLPCAVFGFINKIVFQLTSTQLIDFVWLLVAIFLVAMFWVLPAIHKTEYSKGGKTLVRDPEHLETQKVLGSYLDLNKDANAPFEYQYAVSFWFFLDATSPISTQDISILDYGGKPNVLYNMATNVMKITMKQRADETIVVYKQKKIPLQKWNHVVINYTGGTLDIFFNNRLVKSIPEIIPYMDYDAMTIGANPGIHGSVCNVVYFGKSLSIQKINQLYDVVFKKTPPVV